MKDKLVKFNRRASYYRMRKTAILIGAFFLGIASIAVPISIIVVQANQEVAAVTLPSEGPIESISFSHQ